LAKTEVLYPAFDARTDRPKTYSSGDLLRVVFVGTDWATKGGPVAGRVAAACAQRRLPIEVHVVSSLRHGYADDARRELYDRDRRIITDGPVIYHGPLPNHEVHALIGRSHVLMLPSLGDTFGYSVLEGFAHALPALVSSTHALPEIVETGRNGIVVNLPTNDLGSWEHLGRKEWDCIDEAYASMTEQACDALERIVMGEIDYDAMSSRALDQLRLQHAPLARNRRLDEIYTAISRS
jgi:glycosyltransferase involved in cell wall biosynthesis